MELQILDFQMFMVTPSPFTRGVLPHDPGASCLTAWGDLPRGWGGARRLTCNYLGNISTQAYEVENKEVALVESCKNAQSTLQYMRL